MAFEYLDRRLIARNEWRNTTNNFQGFRSILGQRENDWQLDVLAVQPIERLISQPDRVDEERWFYGVIGDWRQWSEVITFQSYYLLLDQNGKEDRIDRTIHTLALRGYGIVSIGALKRVFLILGEPSGYIRVPICRTFTPGCQARRTLFSSRCCAHPLLAAEPSIFAL